MTQINVQDLERRLWLEGSPAYEEILAPDCIMAFAAPVGILRGAAIHQSLKALPRWDDVEISETDLAQPDDSTLVHAYRAVGHREGDAPYRAYCTSTYRRTGEGWCLIQHQQTPD
ncbi:uncharacterized protein DUF4440 [Hoeflea marina]|uniref:Uncharacterized protein DUF4440 n=1 Tax=Hoeflea marina TaxID=274592 RepID=A0A317PQC0_9HYPH|nr:nuclear transport factor 2 family protein [Hoeflea marina]PWW02148.1 uncharacterized protein DUF4440 [Hoeflea marina]